MVLCGILDGVVYGVLENLHVRRGKVRLELTDELVKLARLHVHLRPGGCNVYNRAT